MDKQKGITKALLVAAAFACATTAEAATDYYAITPAAGSTDPMYASSVSGYTSANGDPVGWAAEMGSSTVAIPGITAANSVYHIWQGSLLHRSPSGSQGQGVFATPATSSIIIEDNCTWDVVGKIANGGVLTLNNLSVKGGATFYYHTNSDSTSNERQTVAGSIDMAEGSLAKFNSYVHNSTKTTYLTKAATLSATVTGRGRITMFRGAAAISGTGTSANANKTAIVQQITGDISGFTGDLEVYGEGDQRNVTLQLVNAASIPGDPEPEELSYVIVTNGATLQINHDWVSPTNRIWILGESGQPTIYVAAGKTVTINGPVIGTVGLTKTGDGTLLINDRSRLYGTITVSAGKAPRFVYITPDADGTGNGGSWSSPMMLTNYLVTANIKNDDVVRIKSGHYTAQIAQVTFGKAFTVKISGGYAGTDDTTLDAEFPYSDIDFAHYPNSLNYAPFLLQANAGYSVSFERLQLRRARNVPFYKDNNGGNLYLSDCVVVSNGWRNYSSSSTKGGRGIHAEAGKLFMTNCVIAYNGMYSYVSGTSSYGDHGFGVYLKNTQAEMVGCRIYGNGSRINQETTDSAAQTIRGGGRGMAVYATGSTKLTAIDCDFVCNKALMGYYDDASTTAYTRGRGTGGTVVLDAVTSTGSSFSNCAWIANMSVNCHAYGGINNDFGGALNVNASSPTSVVNVDNCTFAYNLTDSTRASPGLDVWRGVVNVRNSIFVGNHKLASCEAGADIMVRTGAVVNVSNTILPGTGDWNVKTETIGEDTGTVNLRDIVVGDALLASETLASTNLIQTYSKKTATTKITLTCLRYKVANIDEVLAFDVHPRSKAGRWTAAGYAQDKEHSPAIDAGDPAAPVGAEPKPNGRRLNLGRYGGTAEASLTLTGGTILLVQ